MPLESKVSTTGLNLIGLISGLMAAFAFLAFYITGEDVGNYYYLGTFFTSLNIAVLCLCFGKVYEILNRIYQEVEK